MTKEIMCWNCQTLLDPSAFFCDKCKKIQAPKKINDFDLFGMDIKYDIDKEELEKKYLGLQILFHPDKFFTSSEIERNYSIKFSSMINEAYQNLGNSYLRANIILKLEGHNISKDDESFNDEEILEEIMELQNKCFDVNDLDSKKEMLNEIDRNINITIKNLSESFGNRDFKSANKNNIKFSYLEKMKKNLKSLL